MRYVLTVFLYLLIMQTVRYMPVLDQIFVWFISVTVHHTIHVNHHSNTKTKTIALQIGPGIPLVQYFFYSQLPAFTKL